MKPHATTPTSGRFGRKIDADVARLREAWPAAIGGDAAAMRHVRIATRRLRVALEAAARIGNRRRVESLTRRLKAIGRLLGPARDLGVTRDLLASELEAHPDEARALERATRAIKRYEKTVVIKMRRKADRMDIDEVARKLGDAARAVDAGPRQLQSAVAFLLATRVARAERSLAACGALYEPETLHGLRVAVKKLRYAVEFAASFSMAQRRLAYRLKPHQRRLGLWHDRVVLQRSLREADASSSGAVGTAVAERLEAESRLAHGRIVRSLRYLGATIEAIRREAAGLARPGHATAARAELGSKKSLPARRHLA